MVRRSVYVFLDFGPSGDEHVRVVNLHHACVEKALSELESNWASSREIAQEERREEVLTKILQKLTATKRLRYKY